MLGVASFCWYRMFLSVLRSTSLTSFFGLLNQCAVFQFMPANPPRKGDFEARETTRICHRGVVRR
jgi:hypothetical protein